MAIITKSVGGDGDPVRGYMHFEIDYDDVLLRLTALRCVNESTEATFGRVINLETGREYSQIFPASQTTEISIPGNAAQRLNITITPNGKIDGCDYHFMWPAP